MNSNLSNVEIPPIDYFNHLLDNSPNKNKKISFGHGIPKYTPNEYANIREKAYSMHVIVIPLFYLFLFVHQRRY